MKKNDVQYKNSISLSKYSKKNHIKNKILQKNKKKFVKKYDIMSNNMKKKIFLNNTIQVSELAKKMAIKSSKIINKLLEIGQTVTIDEFIDQETAQLIVEEMGHNAILHDKNFLEKSIIHDIHRENQKYKKTIRPPIVTIMGHVDHGKTSLLDYIRTTRIASQEQGGITQHIGAYHVKTQYGIITFLDTPGHAAFTLMRARGAKITDIVVLVVASDDGVKPQTIEAIQHAKAANVPLLIVISKIDKKESNIEKVKKELLQHDILPEEWGGQTIFVNVSSVTGEGVENLLRAILLQAEILELSSVKQGLATGVVVESSLDKYRGPTATMIIREGRLNKGDNILCGLTHGKVRCIQDSFGQSLQYATPSIPVKVLGLSNIPSSGDIFYVVRNEKKIRQMVLEKKNQFQFNKFNKTNTVSLENIFDHVENKKNNALNIILKSDVHGSLEAISNAILLLSKKNIFINILISNVGEITETDVSLAIASNAIIIGFNVRPNTAAKRLIKLENVDVRYYSIIYQLINDMKTVILRLNSPIHRTTIVGSAEIRNIFKPTKSTIIAGCMVVSGAMTRNDTVHIIRNNAVIHKGQIESLRRFKEDIKTVGLGKECGLKIKNYNDLRIGDIIESYAVVKTKK